MPVALCPISLAEREDRERFYAQVVAALRAGTSDDLELVLRHISFLPAPGVLALMNVARLWSRSTGKITTLRCVHRQVHQYLERVDALTTGAGWLRVDGDLDPSQYWDRSQVSDSVSELLVIPADELPNAEAVAHTTRHAKHILSSWIECDDNAINRLCIMLAELASNITHSGDFGLTIMQRYQMPSARRPGSRVVIAIADLGVGIEASLRQRPRAIRGAHLTLGSDFIMHALQSGVTSREEAGGTGLYQIRKWIEEWSGVLTIRSQGACVVLGRGTPQVFDGLTVIPGTQVALNVHHNVATSH